MNTKCNWTNKSKINSEFTTKKAAKYPQNYEDAHWKKNLLLPSEIMGFQ